MYRRRKPCRPAISFGEVRSTTTPAPDRHVRATCPGRGSANPLPRPLRGGCRQRSRSCVAAPAASPRLSATTNWVIAIPYERQHFEHVELGDRVLRQVEIEEHVDQEVREYSLNADGATMAAKRQRALKRRDAASSQRSTTANCAMQQLRLRIQRELTQRIEYYNVSRKNAMQRRWARHGIVRWLTRSSAQSARRPLTPGHTCRKLAGRILAAAAIAYARRLPADCSATATYA